MRAIEEIRQQIERLERRNSEIDEATKHVEVLWAWSVNNPLFHERERNIHKLVTLRWVVGELSKLP